MIDGAEQFKLQRFQHEFIIAHVPRLFRLIMEAFPGTKRWFNYSLVSLENNPYQLTLMRGEKILARNFEVEDVNFTGVGR